MRLAKVIGLGLAGAFALSGWAAAGDALARRWLGPEELPSASIALCSDRKQASRGGATATHVPAGLQEDNASPNVVYLVPATNGPSPSDPGTAQETASLSPSLVLSAPARVQRGRPLALDASWQARGTRVNVAHPFHAGGKTQVEYTLFVRDEATQRTYRLVDETPMMCGTRNALGDRDFITLDEHQEQHITPRTDTGADLSQVHLLAPGKYTVWLAYAFCDQGHSFFLTRDRRPPPATFSGEVTSNAVVVDVL